ncbi:tryptophanyl-tRNA synthase [Candidatus Desulfofervidus auxilii]|uniref:Tryptophan--tRNA ligase n=2 Tax=Desulfofervidus auxilii TaxID=1621989 RepID=A0A7U4QM06_DESA2|nr:tryptophan--tRNA ligase [Candidatus Desulfofervidus auxilii]AMM41809.1 tryptophanyl-tRNA synthase [Candidatus Desulfofervidus auxilii]
MEKRVLSGMRPTGKLHLGNLHGALTNWKRLQEEYECFFFVADWHALTSEYQETNFIKEFIWEMLIDWLSVGLDPNKSTLFIQSKLPEHAELHLIFSMITPIPWLERNPTYKEQIKELVEKDLNTYGFLGYPVLQAADILIYKANFVPVGVDQLPHVEITREIARRFNYLYKEVFPIPEPILTEMPKILGIDGRKMSKSYHNAIYLSDPPKVIREKTLQMFTDKTRLRKTDPGHPDICNVFSFHKLYTSPEKVSQIEEDCKKARIGCVECKKLLAENLINGLAPLQEKRQYYQGHLEELKNIIDAGIKKARSVATTTLGEAKEAIGI